MSVLPKWIYKYIANQSFNVKPNHVYYTKINWKQTIYLNVKHKTIKHFKITRETLCDQRDLGHDTKSTHTQTHKNINWTLPKCETFALRKTLLRERKKDKLLMGKISANLISINKMSYIIYEAQYQLKCGTPCWRLIKNFSCNSRTSNGAPLSIGLLDHMGHTPMKPPLPTKDLHPEYIKNPKTQ